MNQKSSDHILVLWGDVQRIASTTASAIPYWIATPDGLHMTDSGASLWCEPCADAVIDDLRARDPENAEEYCLDGGWVIKAYGSSSCAGCGVRLMVDLSSEGVVQDIEHYETHPPDRDDAGYVLGMIECVVDLEEDHPKRAALTERVVVIGQYLVDRNGQRPS